MPAPADRSKALENALAHIDKSFGKGSVMRLGDDVRAPMEVIPTGSIALDVALGIGGLPRGRVVEVYGPESSGKTSISFTTQSASACEVETHNSALSGPASVRSSASASV